MYAYGYIHFICLIQIQKCINTEIYTVYRKSANKYRDINFCSYHPALIYVCLYICNLLKNKNKANLFHKN